MATESAQHPTTSPNLLSPYDPGDDTSKPLLIFSLRTIPLLRLVTTVLTLAILILGTAHVRPSGIFFLIILYLLLFWNFVLSIQGLVFGHKKTGSGTPRMSFQVGEWSWSCGGGKYKEQEDKKGLVMRRMRKSLVDVVFGVFVVVVGACGEVVWNDLWWYRHEYEARDVLCFVVAGFEFGIAFLNFVWFLHGVRIEVYTEEEEEGEYRIRLPETRTGKDVSMTSAV